MSNNKKNKYIFEPNNHHIKSFMNDAFIGTKYEVF
jgi:hypothetical protein